MTGERQELDYALPLAVWLSRFNGSERDFWDTMSPARLDALCEALAPPEPEPVPRWAPPPAPKGAQTQKSLRDIFKGVTF